MRRLLVTFGLFSIAACAEANWNGSQLLRAIYPQDGSANILIQQDTYDGSGCSHANGKFFSLNANHVNQKAIYALLLSAYHAGTPVNLFLKNGVCTSERYSEISLAILGSLNRARRLAAAAIAQAAQSDGGTLRHAAADYFAAIVP